MSTNPTTPRRRRPAALHLIWAAPLSLIGAIIAYGLAVFHRCGITECRTPDKGSDTVVALLALIGGLFLAAPFWLVPWTWRGWLRGLVGAGLATVTAIGMYLFVTSL